MAREKVGITLTSETLERLVKIGNEMGLSKSQAIAMLINEHYVNNAGKYEKRGG